MIEADYKLHENSPRESLCTHMIEWAIPRKGIKAASVIEEGVRFMLETHPGSIQKVWELMAADMMSSVMSCADIARKKGLDSYAGLRKERLLRAKAEAKLNGLPVPVRRKRPSKSERAARAEAEVEAKRRKDKYRQYLKSQRWIVFRDAIVNERGSQCDNCGSVGKVQVHHLSYERLGRELPIDVQILCRSCHRMIHGLQ